MTDLPLITVTIPVRNGEAYIAQCIENVLFQSYKNIEIIVVDNGSTDKTAQIAQQYSTIKYIYEPNGGLSGARNAGMDAAEGEYIHFIDVDDLVTLNYHEKMTQAAIETKADMACSGFIFERFPTQTQRIEHKLVVSTTEDKILFTNVANYPACWRYFYKLSFLKDNSLRYEDNRYSQDKLFTVQAIYLANRIVTVPEAVYFYKHRERAITTSKDMATIRKRRADRRYANRFRAEYAQKNGFALDKSLYRHSWQYKLLGIPFLTKTVYYPGKIRWFFLGIPIFQKKDIGK